MERISSGSESRILHSQCDHFHGVALAIEIELCSSFSPLVFVESKVRWPLLVASDVRFSLQSLEQLVRWFRSDLFRKSVGQFTDAGFQHAVQRHLSRLYRGGFGFRRFAQLDDETISIRREKRQSDVSAASARDAEMGSSGLLPLPLRSSSICF